MSQMQEPNLLERGLTRKAREQCITSIQKFCIWILGIVVLGSFAMMCLQAVGIVDPEVLYFSHILVSVLGIITGYLFGNNAKISMSGNGF